MPQHIPFPDIQQFRNTIRTVRERAEHDGVPLPTLSFVGSVKLHGTNASVVLSQGKHYCQSRSQIITPENDNAGFARWVEEKDKKDNGERLHLAEHTVYESSGAVLYGEWHGIGIQKGVAISQVPRNFIVFAVRVLDENGGYWAHPGLVQLYSAHAEFDCIYNFPIWKLEIDFNKPEESQNKLVELTQAVEAECPVGKAFGVSGVGEGIVWWPEPNASFNTRDLAFKVKGEKHSETKVKTLAAVDVEKLASLNELVDTILTEHRLEKKLESLQEQGHPLDIKSTGAFLKLVGSDVYKEEADTITASGFKDNEVMSAIQKKAKKFWMEKVSV
jgi:hypothetical protein